MKNICIPDFYFKSIYDINFNELKRMGIENLIIDIDNTLVSWGSRFADDKVNKFIKELRDMKFNICLLSNSSRKRVKRFRGEMDVELFTTGIKPMKTMFLGALRKLDGKPENTCAIGDQIFTDIVGANRCGLYTILVDPISKDEFITTKWIRKIECNIRGKLEYEKRLRKR